MEEVIKYFEQLEARLAAAEERNAALENRLAAMDTRIDELKSEREQLLSRLAELENAQQEVKPKLAAIVGHLNRMNEILEDAQMRSLEPEKEEEPEPVVEPEQEIQSSRDQEIQEPEPEPEIQSSGDPEIQEPEQEPVVEPEPEPAPIAETPVAPKEEQVSPKAAIYGKAVDDIRLAISLGDRFLYQRELFGQNAEKMQRTLDELNRLGSFDEAIAYINSHFQWDTESNTYQQFLVTLHRRFG